MFNDDDECDSSIASQSDIDAFLHAQTEKNTGEIPRLSNSYLSQSCFASISSKSTISEDLTELKWLNTFKLKDYLSQKCSDAIPDRMKELIEQLKSSQSIAMTNHSFGMSLFIAFYSKRDDLETPWALTMKQCYDYFQSNVKSLVEQRHWKYLLRQTLINLPCFVQKKDETTKSRLLWTIDHYYRPLLTRAYTTNLSSTLNKTLTEVSNNRSSEVNPSLHTLIDHYPPKATIKKAALPRLFERLCEDSTLFSTESIERKRTRSTSIIETHRSERSSDDSLWTKKSKKYLSRPLNSSAAEVETNESTIVTPCPSLDHSYTYSSREILQEKFLSIDINDEHQKTSPVKKRSSIVVLSSSHRAKTRMSRRIIEHDLKLLRQGQPLTLSTNLLRE